MYTPKRNLKPKNANNLVHSIWILFFHSTWGCDPNWSSRYPDPSFISTYSSVKEVIYGHRQIVCVRCPYLLLPLGWTNEWRQTHGSIDDMQSNFRTILSRQGSVLFNHYNVGSSTECRWNLWQLDDQVGRLLRERFKRMWYIFIAQASERLSHHPMSRLQFRRITSPH